ncbi:MULTISPECIES: hypothetical protein [unclassified Streptomyces]|uniref:DUF6197 family protein n=1 Tax=unclassified Streptomyces TaxID=2593676 RepID=UPI00332254A1
MQTATRLGAKPAAQPITLDERLTLSSLAMDERLAGAHGDMAIRTAHIDTPDTSDLGFVAQLDNPLAALLQRAQRRLEAAGWCRTAATDNTGAICPLHAIHLEASSDTEEGKARTLLLQAIRVEDRNVVSIPHWNSQQSGPAAPIRMLRAAARLA